MSRIAIHVSRRHAQRGASLLESLFAFVVLAVSTLAVAHLQGGLRLDGDLARQRSEALRIGEAEIESLRGFAVVAAASGVSSYAAIADADATVAAGNASYRIARRIDGASLPGAKAATVRVGWTDRGGAAREISLASVIAGVDPAYAGALGLGAGAVPSSARGAFGRAPAVPVEARDLGDGRSVWKPSPDATSAVVFDNAGGDIVATCSVPAATSMRELTGSDLSACTSGRRLLVRGAIRFTSAAPALASAAGDTPPAVAVGLELVGGSDAPPPVCTTEAKKTVRYVAAGSLHIDAVALDATPASLGLAAWAEEGDRYVAWSCLVTPRADGRWSGRAVLVPGTGWALGTAATARRACRYGAEPARDFVDVGTSLSAQNFLVVRGDLACPPTSVALQGP